MTGQQGIIMNLKKLAASLSRREADGAQTWRTQTALRTRRPRVPTSAGAGLRQRRVHRSSLSDRCRRRRLHLRMPGSGRRHVALSRRLTRELDANIVRREKPRTIVSDYRTELTSMAVLECCESTPVEWHYIAPASRCRMAS